MTKYFNLNGQVVMIFPGQSTEFVVRGGGVEITEEEANELRKPEPIPIQDQFSQLEKLIENYIETTLAERGYTQYTIPIYFESPNDAYKTEALLASKWITNIWVESYKILNDGLERGELPTIDYITSKLPKLEW